ncbi:lectin [Capsulimonas corticalis]|uniref:Lectin n=1 Tax=Capsulimonas corticalis TaxID=2219043 RepID=A0A402CUP2_9BACT|nr:RICIN domain-containing protein [Capsulimonas corticalis]BDI29046.1 lectin [Capsulimonas corticalis]
MKTQLKDAVRVGKMMVCLALAGAAGMGGAHAGSPVGDVVGKVTVGYQGWFSSAGDGSPSNSWNHTNYELWPDVREYTTTYQTPYANLGNGQPAKMFSSYDQSTVNVHFNWMAQNGIDTAALQRFVNEITPGSTLKAQRDGEATRVMNAAQAAGRKFYIMYDTSGGTAGMETDWTNTIVNTLHLTSSSAYAKQNGKPVVCIWGVGYKFFPNPTDGAAIINWFKAQGCYVIAGVAGDWRTGSGGANDNTQAGYGAVWPLCDMIMPWQVGGGPDQPWMTADYSYCNSHNIDYQSDVYPGFSFHNSNGSTQNAIPRNHGDFMWSQFALVKQVGVPSVYISMFDEMNEGTAIFKCAEDSSMIPTNQWFLTLDADGKHVSSDYYLRLTNNGGKMIKGALPYQAINSTPFTVNSSVSAGTYRIIGRQSGRALDVAAQGAANGSAIDLWDYNAGGNQQWVITPVSGGYKIIGAQSGRALDAAGQGTANGTAINLWDYNGGGNQVWTISPTDSGYFKIIGAQSGRALDAHAQLTANGTAIDLWDWDGGLNQQWSIGAP